MSSFSSLRFVFRSKATVAGLLGLTATLWRPTCALAQETAPLPPAFALKKMSVEELMDIQVTSVSKRPEKLSETASAIQVISGEDIRRSSATSIPEALRLASNLEVAQVDSRQWAISARGFNNVFADKLLVLIDGRSVYTPLYAGVYWDVQDTMLEDLDRIEVISGPGATQWGANAVNGVINITTKSAKDTQGGLVVSEVGTTARDTAAVRYGGQLAPGLYYRVYGKYFERDDSIRPSGQAANDAWRSGQGGFRIDWDRATGEVVTLQGDLYTGSIGRSGPQDASVSGGNTLARWTRSLSESSQVRVQLYYDHTHRRIPGSFTQALDTYDLDLQHSVALGGVHAIVWGGGVRVVRDDIQNTPANAFLPPQVVRTGFSAFAQDEVTVFKELHLTLGSKVEHDGYSGYQTEPSARLAWTPGKTQLLWTAVSRAVRTPSRIDRDLYSPATPPYRIAGGPHVQPEKLLSYELGYRVQVDPQLALTAATFYNLYDDLRSMEPLNPPAPFPIEINSELQGKAWGAELSADWRVLPTWRIHAGYTAVHAESEPQPGSASRPSPRSTAHDPRHQVLLRSFWDISSRWECDFDVRYVAPIENQRVPAYSEANLHLAWRPTDRWELALVGENLLHRRHAEFNLPASRRELQRGVYTKALWRF